MPRDTQSSIQVVMQADGFWFWRKLNGSNDVIATDRGHWSLEKAIYAAHESNPELDRLTVILPAQDPALQSAR